MKIPSFRKSIEWEIEHHFLQMNRYLNTINNYPGLEDKETIEDYLENHLPNLSKSFKRYFTSKVTDRFNRKYEELKRAYENTPQF